MSLLIRNQGTFSVMALLWLLLYFWFFSTALQAYIMVTGYSGTTGLRDSLLYSSLWLIPVFLFPHKTRLIAAVIGVILWLSSAAALAYFVIYGQEFSQSVLFVMFETNANEAREFASQYFSLKLLIILLLYTAVTLFLWTRLRPVYIPTPCRYGVATAILYGLIIQPLLSDVVFNKISMASAVNSLNSRMEPAAPWQLVSSYVQYRNQLNSLESLLSKNSALPPLANLKDSSGNAPRTLVLVIGESTQRNRMSLYGYARETTPKLDALRNSDPNFTVFNDVVTSRPYTIEILQQALTFANEENPDRYLTTPSLMNMMKQAGYKTFWITNQQTMTARNTMLTVFSRQTDKQYYMNQQRTQSAHEYDTNVLTPFKDVLKDPAPRKFIVVHLLGTHIKYQYRYPELAQWDRFTGKTDNVPANLNPEQQITYNDYDNANLYNDNVLSQLIADYKATDPNGFMVYFSDHGEEVYDTAPHTLQGRNESSPTRAMYTIPFFVWTSDKWQAANPRNLRSDINRKFSLMNFIYTWSDLARLSYDGYDPTRSLANQQFVQTPRWIGNPYQKDGLRDFDTLPDGTKNVPVMQ